MEKIKIHKKVWFVPVTTGIVVGIIAFYLGMNYGQQSAAASRQQAMQQFRGQRTGTGQQNGGGVINGQVLSKDAQSVTVKMRDGSSKIVFYSSSTSVTKPTPGSINDISANSQVMIVGTQNSDGSVTAQSIQVRPAQSQ